MQRKRALFSVSFVVSLFGSPVPHTGDPQAPTRPAVSIHHPPLTVGILEDDRAETLNEEGSAPSKNRVVRVTFAKEGSEWIPAPSANKPTEWIIAFDGRSLGRVQSVNRAAGGEQWADVQDVANLAALPQIGKPSRRFGQSLSETVRRPLVVVSEPNFEDPDRWKPASLPPTLVAKVRDAFRKAFPNARRCDYRKETELPEPWDYSEADLRLTDVYRSNSDSFLVHTRPAKGVCGYTDNPADPFADHWFLVLADGRAVHIGAFMELVDAGDYDHDGKSELVFSYGRPEDEDGYILFYDSFRKQVKVSWTYH